MKIWQTLKIFFYVLLALSFIPILSGWIGDISREWIKGEPPGLTDCILLLVGGLFVPVFAYLVARKGQQYLSIQKVEQSDDVKTRSVVIAMLSPAKNLSPPQEGEDKSAWLVEDKRNDKSLNLKGLSLEQFINLQGKDIPRLSWQQTLRAAHHHKEKLEKLVLIGSSGKGGSGEDLRLAHQFFSHYFPGKIKIMGANEGGTEFDNQWQADFEQLESLRKLLSKVLNQLQTENNYKLKDIIIDCSGGQKTASIASALITLDKPDLACQYVRTDGENTGKILGFNAVTEPRNIN